MLSLRKYLSEKNIKLYDADHMSLRERKWFLGTRSIFNWCLWNVFWHKIVEYLQIGKRIFSFINLPYFILSFVRFMFAYKLMMSNIILHDWTYPYLLQSFSYLENIVFTYLTIYILVNSQSIRTCLIYYQIIILSHYQIINFLKCMPCLICRRSGVPCNSDKPLHLQHA